MQFRKTFIFTGLLLLLGLVKLASAKTEFEPGKDYEQLNQSELTNTSDKSNKVTVIEFFNYGCGACAFLEPKLNQWLQTKSAEINFEKVPVVFHSDWEFLAKSYYIA